MRSMGEHFVAEYTSDKVQKYNNIQYLSIFYEIALISAANINTNTPIPVINIHLDRQPYTLIHIQKRRRAARH